MGVRNKLIELRLEAVQSQLDQIQKGILKMSKAVDDIVAEVAAMKTEVDSTKTLLEKLFAAWQTGIDSGDMVKMQQALNDLRAQKQELADAVIANTPAA